MNRALLQSVLIAGVLAAAAGASAQAACPSSNRLTIVPHGQAPLDLTSGSFRIYVGIHALRENPTDPRLHAIVSKNGTCLGVHPIMINGSIQSRLPANTNVCLGGFDDFIEVVTTSKSVTCNGATPITPLDYGGFSLSIYGGSGNDTIYGGNSQDILYGGNGNDSLVGLPGTSDRAYGENGNDTIFASIGSGTVSSGGADADTIVDRQGVSDTLEGGSGNDAIDSGCHVSTISCTTGTDTVWYPDARPWWLTTCETWNDLSC